MKRLLGNIRGMNALELLVVIALIGVLVGFLIPTMSSARMHAKVAQTKMLMSQVSIALEMYHADFKTYPDTLESLDAIGINIETLPKDPFNPDDDYFQYYTNKYPYKGSTYVPGQLWLISSFAPDEDNDVLEVTMFHQGGTGDFPGAEFGFDAAIYDYYDNDGDNDPIFPIDAAKEPGYENGDLILFGPRQPNGLKEVDYGYGEGFFTWEEMGI